MRRMQPPHAGDRLPHRSRAQRTGSSLPLGKFRRPPLVSRLALNALRSTLMRMPVRRPRSLKHEYEEYVEREIEHYKESVPRHKLLSIGDEAVRELGEQPQFALTELLLCEVVDKIIMRRLRIPTYTTWRRRTFKTLDKCHRPEHGALDPESPMVRAVTVDAEANVLVAGSNVEKASLYFAANG